MFQRFFIGLGVAIFIGSAALALRLGFFTPQFEDFQLVANMTAAALLFVSLVFGVLMIQMGREEHTPQAIFCFVAFLAFCAGTLGVLLNGHLTEHALQREMIGLSWIAIATAGAMFVVIGARFLQDHLAHTRR